MNARRENLSVIGKASKRVIAKLRGLWKETSFEDGFDLSFIDAAERKLCRQYGVDLEGIHKREEHADWSQFRTLNHFLDEEAVLQTLRPVYKLKPNHRVELFQFRGYYAQSHDDAQLGWDRQLMVILENPLGHRLWCEDQIMVPRERDVVLLYPNKKHALYPAAGLSANEAAAGHMKIVSIAITREEF